MKHAYLIMAHTDAPLLGILLSMLDDERNDIFLHIDKKAKNLNPRVFSTSRAQLFIIEERIPVYWGHSSQVDLEMLLFRTATKKGSYAYYHLLSGTDLPIKTQDHIHTFFSQHQGKEFVTCWKKRSNPFTHNRMAKYHLFMEWEQRQKSFCGRVFAKLRTLLTHLLGEKNITYPLMTGPNWVSITHDFVSYLLKKEKEIKRLCRYTRNADEIFLQTILWNSPFKANLYKAEEDRPLSKGCLREIFWKEHRTSPEIITCAYWEEIKNSECLFARKFSTVADAEIIQRIKETYGYVHQ